MSQDIPWWLLGKEAAWNSGDVDLITESGRFSGKGMATHSSILAWRILWTEGPGERPSMGLQRVDVTE